MAKLTNEMTKSFMRGLTSFMVIWPEPLQIPYSSPSTDADRLASDWRAVGNDIRSALNKYEREYGKRRKEKWLQ